MLLSGIAAARAAAAAAVELLPHTSLLSTPVTAAHPLRCCRYLLVYPHGCDVANHLSLFLCVADYDKLLPGWSHFAQVRLLHACCCCCTWITLAASIS